MNMRSYIAIFAGACIPLVILVACVLFIVYIYNLAFIEESDGFSLSTDLWAVIFVFCFMTFIPFLIALWALYGLFWIIREVYTWNSHNRGDCTKCHKSGVVEIREVENWGYDHENHQPSDGIDRSSPTRVRYGMKKVFFCTSCNTELDTV